MLAPVHACLAWAGSKVALQTLAEMCLLEQDMMSQTVWIACSEVATVIVCVWSPGICRLWSLLWLVIQFVHTQRRTHSACSCLAYWIHV